MVSVETNGNMKNSVGPVFLDELLQVSAEVQGENFIVSELLRRGRAKVTEPQRHHWLLPTYWRIDPTADQGWRPLADWRKAACPGQVVLPVKPRQSDCCQRRTSLRPLHNKAASWNMLRNTHTPQGHLSIFCLQGDPEVWQDGPPSQSPHDFSTNTRLYFVLYWFSTKVPSASYHNPPPPPLHFHWGHWQMLLSLSKKRRLRNVFPFFFIQREK